MVKNIISAFFSRAGVALINLCILLLVSRYMGSEKLGQISILILNIAVVQSVVEIYSGATLIYFIARHNRLKIYLIGLIWIMLVILLSNAVLQVFSLVDRHMGIHVLLLSAMFSLHAFHLVMLLGKEKIKAYNLLAFLQPFLLLVFLISPVMVEGSRDFAVYLHALYYAIGVSLAISATTVWYSLRGEVNTDKTFSPFAIVSNGLINQAANLSHTLSNRLNYYLLGVSAVVGVYANASSLIESLWVISASISPLLLTHVANERQKDQQGRLTLLLAKLSFLLSLLGVICLFLLPNVFFTFLMGKDFEQTKTVMLCLSPGVLFISFSSLLSHYFSGKGMQKIQLSANLSGMLVTVISAWYLIKVFGIYGACMAASLSYATQAAVLTVVFFKHNHFGLNNVFSLVNDLKQFKPW